MSGLCAGSDPLFDRVNLFAREFFVALRHFATLNHSVEETFFRFARGEDRTVVNTLEHEPAETEIDVAFQFFALAVAIKTVRLEDRTDVFFEEGRSRAGNGKR